MGAENENFFLLKLLSDFKLLPARIFKDRIANTKRSWKNWWKLLIFGTLDLNLDNNCSKFAEHFVLPKHENSEVRLTNSPEMEVKTKGTLAILLIVGLFWTNRLLLYHFGKDIDSTFRWHQWNNTKDLTWTWPLAEPGAWQWGQFYHGPGHPIWPHRLAVTHSSVFMYDLQLRTWKTWIQTNRSEWLL